MLHVLLVLVQMAQPTLGQFLALGGAVLTSFGLSKVKNLDTSVTNSAVFRKLQPAITLGGAFLAPYLGAKLGVSVDPGTWSAAPIATLMAVTGAELGSIIRRSVR